MKKFWLMVMLCSLLVFPTLVMASSVPSQTSFASQSAGGYKPDFQSYCQEQGATSVWYQPGSSYVYCLNNNAGPDQIFVVDVQVVCIFTYNNSRPFAVLSPPFTGQDWSCAVVEPGYPVPEVDVLGNANTYAFGLGERAQVTAGNHSALNYRFMPGVREPVLGRFSNGTSLTILSPRFMVDGYAWYFVVENSRYQRGWIATGTFFDSWLSPEANACWGSNDPSLAVGELANSLYPASTQIVSSLGSNTASRYVSAYQSVLVIAGPSCYNSQWWWQVQIPGTWVTGWISEGRIGDARPLVLLPQTFLNSYPAVYSVGEKAKIDDAPVALRYAPAGELIKAIPELRPGTTFRILLDPVCLPGLEGYLCWYYVAVDGGGYRGWVPLGYGDREAWFVRQ